MGTAEIPPKLAVDANGFVWRVYDEHWSMAPSNPDNEPVPEPVTYYEPVAKATPPADTDRIAALEGRLAAAEGRLALAEARAVPLLNPGLVGYTCTQCHKWVPAGTAHACMPIASPNY